MLFLETFLLKMFMLFSSLEKSVIYFNIDDAWNCSAFEISYFCYKIIAMNASWFKIFNLTTYSEIWTSLKTMLNLEVLFDIWCLWFRFKAANHGFLIFLFFYFTKIEWSVQEMVWNAKLYTVGAECYVFGIAHVYQHQSYTHKKHNYE